MSIASFIACNSNKTTPAQTYHTTPTGLSGLQKTAANNPGPNASQDGNVKVNPSHGQPGHNCDLPVGAPLNQVAATSAQPTTAVVQEMPTPVAVNTSGQKLNPSHGEPGHRCDIAVGAPLHSKPTAVALPSGPAKAEQ